MSRPNLPLCSWQYPSCGACGGETSHDGDAFYCDDCGLDYGKGADGTEATYRDEGRSPCGAPCSGHTSPPQWVALGVHSLPTARHPHAPHALA